MPGLPLPVEQSVSLVWMPMPLRERLPQHAGQQKERMRPVRATALSRPLLMLRAEPLGELRLVWRARTACRELGFPLT